MCICQAFVKTFIYFDTVMNIVKDWNVKQFPMIEINECIKISRFFFKLPRSTIEILEFLPSKTKI